MHRNKWHLNKFLFAAFLFLPLSSYALDNDQQQSITIQADSATFNATNNQAIYQGHVELTQGSLTLTSDTLLIQNSNAGVQSLTATGNPASYSQQLTADKPLVKATAGKVIYYPHEQKIELFSQAQLRQGDSLFQGDHITYDLKQRILSASGNADSKNKSSGRVKMVIPPPPSAQEKAAQPEKAKP